MKCKWCKGGIMPGTDSYLSYTCPDCLGTGMVSCPCGQRLSEAEMQTMNCQCKDCKRFLCAVCSEESEFCIKCQEYKEISE